MSNSLHRCLLALLLAGSASVYAMGERPLPQQVSKALVQTPETLLVQSLLEIGQNRLDTAFATINGLLELNPNFRLAYLIKGDLLMARARPLNGFGGAENAPSERIADLRDEAKVRLARYQKTPPYDRLPKYLLQLQPTQKYALVADTASSTLYVFENRGGEPRYVADYYITSGKNGAYKLKEGDKRTPLGVYYVTDNLPKNKLTEFYGSGAFPISYPNAWDKQHGRNGHGIWLHGTPKNTYSRPPRASDGCVVLTNQDLEALSKNLQIGVTPVVISQGIEWVDGEELHQVRLGLAQQVEAWRLDWESRDTSRYLRHYASSFSANGQNLAAWTRQKQQVNASKEWIKVKLDNIGMFLYPGIDNLAVVTFDQQYASSNLSNNMKKQQYWIQENGTWKIIYEGAV